MGTAPNTLQFPQIDVSFDAFNVNKKCFAQLNIKSEYKMEWAVSWIFGAGRAWGRTWCCFMYIAELITGFIQLVECQALQEFPKKLLNDESCLAAIGATFQTIRIGNIYIFVQMCGKQAKRENKLVQI